MIVKPDCAGQAKNSFLCAGAPNAQVVFIRYTSDFHIDYFQLQESNSEASENFIDRTLSIAICRRDDQRISAPCLAPRLPDFDELR
jgi:hypothetical protein